MADKTDMNQNVSNIDLLSRLLSVASLRHRVIAHNVANVNTPGYREHQVLFEDAFRQALSRGVDGEALEVSPAVVESEGGPERADGNNVDIDYEMARLGKNSTLARVYTQVMASYLAMARSAISGR